MLPAARIVFATALFAVLHSALASRCAKKIAAKLLGERKRDAYYRLFFNLQSLVAFAALVRFSISQPNRELWRTGLPAAFLMNGVRACSLLGLASAVRQIGFSRVSGLGAAASHVRQGPTKPVPEAQGPALDAPVTGPFRFTRHPLNFLAIPLLWFAPRMTRNRFAFNCAATLYFLVGSVHEERRMRQSWGKAYDAYCNQTRFVFGRRFDGEGEGRILNI